MFKEVSCFRIAKKFTSKRFDLEVANDLAKVCRALKNNLPNMKKMISIKCFCKLIYTILCQKVLNSMN